MYYSKDFLALPVFQRASEVRNRKMCVNCLRPVNHAPSKCASRGCRICKAKHNTLLHATDNRAEAGSGDSGGHKETKAASSPLALVTHASSNNDREHVMLSTAVVHAIDSQGSFTRCRVLLDCGSQANFISRECMEALGLQPRSLDVSISGINQTATRSTQVIGSRASSRRSRLSVNKDAYKLPRNLKLADPQFNVSSKIDFLIGAELFWDLCVGQVKSSTEHPTLQKTRLGWILAGRLGNAPKPTRRVQALHASVTNVQLHAQLSRFWQLEDICESSNHTLEEAYCERHFLDNVSQTPEGRYVVKLPVKESLIASLGDSRDIALKRLNYLERRFRCNAELKDQYVRFMSEYLAQGHMRRVEVQPDEGAVLYLPHHCVFKNSKQPSKIRVVFDASCKSNTGTSLNDILRVGPVVQQDLASIVMRFRTFAYVMVADIIKMYRQMLIHPSQTCLQRILWRDDPASEIETYELITVTYSTSSASFLATRCLQHLAKQHSSNYPIGSMHVGCDFYIDDLLTGADTIQEAIAIRDESIQLLSLGSFPLSKWASNCPELLRSVNKQGSDLIDIDDGDDSYVLGIRWNQATDAFHYSYEPDVDLNAVSKRTILSEVSRLFDPLGLLGPIIVVAKLILQDLWRSGAHWDESVPQDLHTR